MIIDDIDRCKAVIIVGDNRLMSQQISIFYVFSVFENLYLFPNFPIP